MKNIFLCGAYCCTLLTAAAQNVSINNTDPKSALDISGGIGLRPLTNIVSGTSLN